MRTQLQFSSPLLISIKEVADYLDSVSVPLHIRTYGRRHYENELSVLRIQKLYTQYQPILEDINECFVYRNGQFVKNYTRNIII